MKHKFKVGNIVKIKKGDYIGKVFKIKYIYSPPNYKYIYYIHLKEKSHEMLFSEENLRLATKQEIKEWLVDEL